MPPGRASTVAADLAAATTRVERDFRALGSATTITQYQTIGSSSGIDQATNAFDRDYRELIAALTVR